ncbi:hypothetical protein H0H81_009919 [Sphagnurus paluster]|uniref:Uncharacterized protein n=1 Tax=Sphagnurus paluster TaxID=117069 RepID=A0A9P7GWG9_9AGAR|nr:hypothetical protein H0H81_009919 [Sphagnurus paluster]
MVCLLKFCPGDTKRTANNSRTRREQRRRSVLLFQIAADVFEIRPPTQFECKVVRFDSTTRAF